jgi:DNA-binding transcriptional LysR family regulator
MRYTLRQLEVFLAVARTGSVSRAGDELAMSQSAVSGSLADLERQFDVRLFDRLGKRLQLSDVGRALRSRAEATFDQARELEGVLAKQTDDARLRVGATLTIGNYVVVPLMARYMREGHGAMIRLDIANTEAITRRVANFELDVGLIEGELAHPDLAITPFRDDELVVFAAPSHPLAKKLAKRRRLTDADLKSADWIVREHGSGTRQAFDRAMTGILPELHVALELPHTEVIKRAVEAGLGVGCISRLALADAFRARTLKACPVPHRDFRRRFYTVLHRQKHVGTGLRRWLDLL